MEVRERLAEGMLGQELARLGFRPALWDFATQAIYPLGEALPGKAVEGISPGGRVPTGRPTLVAGYERKGFFYTRTATAFAIAQWGVLDDELPAEDDY